MNNISPAPLPWSSKDMENNFYHSQSTSKTETICSQKRLGVKRELHKPYTSTNNNHNGRQYYPRAEKRGCSKGSDKDKKKEVLTINVS